MRKSMIVGFTSAAVLMIFYASSCKKSTITKYDCNGVTSTYTSNVKAILDANCATSGCHNSSSKAKGIDLSTYTGAKSAAGNDSFMGSVEHVSGYDAMPQGGSKLSTSDITTLSCWVQNGEPQ